MKVKSYVLDPQFKSVLSDVQKSGGKISASVPPCLQPTTNACFFSQVSLQSSVLPLQNCPPFICGKLWIILAARSVRSAFLLLLKEHVK